MPARSARLKNYLLEVIKMYMIDNLHGFHVALQRGFPHFLGGDVRTGSAEVE